MEREKWRERNGEREKNREREMERERETNSHLCTVVGIIEGSFEGKNTLLGLPFFMTLNIFKIVDTSSRNEI